MENEYLTVKQVLKKLNISRGFLYRFINDGSLKIYKLGNKTLIKQSDIDKFMKAHGGRK